MLILAALSAPPRAEPVLSLAGTMPASGDYGEVIGAMREMRLSSTSILLRSDDFDRGNGYDPMDDWPAIANQVYPALDIRLHLTLAVIDTVADRRPADLRDRPWDDPETVARFNAFLTEVLTRMADVDLIAISIGNEVDATLTDATRPAYARFFAATRAHARTLRPDVPVTVTQTYAGLMATPGARELANLGDGWAVTYYPLEPDFTVRDPDTVPTDMAGLRSLATPPIWLVEAGFPSDGCGAGSPAAQARFFDLVLEETRDFAFVNLTWSHDIGDAEVETYTEYYGVGTPCFARYLGSLGLKASDDRPKPAFDAMVRRAR
ncbi:hypothetical protein [Jannaschia pohangensis]|nr:hypothetical protein [Jannaschia pohangensis]